MNYTEKLPTAEQFFELFETTDWNTKYELTMSPPGCEIVKLVLTTNPPQIAIIILVQSPKGVVNNYIRTDGETYPFF